MKNFNSHPHEEDDNVADGSSASLDISTHILTKRMTDYALRLLIAKNISTHILTKRMTSTTSPISSLQLISTHILTKRMTVTVWYELPETCYFNSHPHEEDDSVSDKEESLLSYFNSHPHEEDDRYAIH